MADTKMQPTLAEKKKSYHNVSGEIAFLHQCTWLMAYSYVTIADNNNFKKKKNEERKKQ